MKKKQALIFFVVCFFVLFAISVVMLSVKKKGEKEQQQTTEAVTTETTEEITTEEVKEKEPVPKLTDEESIEQHIKDTIAGMTLEQKLAQMMILTNGIDMTQENLQTYEPGGVIFFGGDFEGKTIKEVRDRVDTMQSYVNLPLLVGVDEEGGIVTRVKSLNEPDIPVFRGARELYGAGIEEVKSETEVKVQILKELGINLNFNPVADTVADEESYMFSRSASGDPNEAAEYVEAVVSVMDAGNMGTCVKHFPGYGNNVNTHDTFARDGRELSAYEEGDFLPFKKGIDAGVDIVMVSHIIMEAVDSENPSSLSPEVHKIIREKLGYNGVILTDDLNMGAIINDMTMKEATAKALAAGNDMVFSADLNASLEGAKEAVESGAVTEAQIDESVARILRMKINRDLLWGVK